MKDTSQGITVEIYDQPYHLRGQDPAYIERLAAHHILNGYNDGSFRPGLTATRGQVAKIITNTFYPAHNTR